MTLTKKDCFNLIIQYLENNAGPVESSDTLIKFCKKEIVAIDDKATKAKARAQEKKQENPLRALVMPHLSASPVPLHDLCRKVSTTSAKLAPCMTQMHREGLVERHQVKRESGTGMVVAYSLANIQLQEEEK